MSTPPTTADRRRKPAPPNWRTAVRQYQQSDHWLSTWQIINTVVPYVLLWIPLVWSLNVSYLLTLLLAIPAAGLAMRMFIIMHDCGHGSFYKSKRANDLVGLITGVLVFTPYYYWRHNHAVHHATSGDLDRRGVGDVWTMTVEEYRSAPRLTQLRYRLFRNPFFLFVIAAPLDFLFLHRLPMRADVRPRERNNVWWTNLAILGMVIGMSALLGFWQYVVIQLPIIWLASAAGVWMFYVQHQYEDVYFERHDNWDYAAAALYGSSFYKLPRILNWFTGNIGFHHIHHLSPRIPNYKLAQCHEENPIFQDVGTITLASSLKSLKFRLWDEASGQLVGFDHLKKLEAQEAAQEQAQTA